MILVNLFMAFFRIGLFAIGGAYSFLPLIEKEVVQRYHWLTKEEFLDVLGMARILPGAISVKYATYTGYKMAKLPGAIIANFGNLIGPAVLIFFASLVYTKYKNLTLAKSAFSMIQLAMFAMIISVAFQVVSINQLTQPKSLLVIIISVILFSYTKVHPAVIIVLAGMLGILLK